MGESGRKQGEPESPPDAQAEAIREHNEHLISSRIERGDIVAEEAAEWLRWHDMGLDGAEPAREVVQRLLWAWADLAGLVEGGNALPLYGGGSGGGRERATPEATDDVLRTRIRTALTDGPLSLRNLCKRVHANNKRVSKLVADMPDVRRNTRSLELIVAERSR